MLNLNSLLVIIFFTSGVGLFHTIKEKETESITQATHASLTTTFMLYASSLDTFKKSHPAYTGRVSAQLSLPNWLGKKPEIIMHIDNGTGYVYMPNKAHLYPSLMRATENSSMIGITNDHHVITLSGQTNKPPFIPKNHIVYIR